MKDFVPQDLRSHVVCKFTCVGCNATCIDKTVRYISTRVREHFVSDRSSHEYKHLATSKTSPDSVQLNVSKS